LANIVTGIGAGIYEELVFRLLLICGLMIAFQDLAGLSHKHSIILSVVISSALFSAHHHIDILTGQTSSVFSAAAFVFRTLAGIYFAILFAIRGFGVTSGTHAFYNIIATCINTLFFQ
ncbi:MAG: CPBP family intramembrane glutamic endopeptidase, partial [Planctomycetota bacterium]